MMLNLIRRNDALHTPLIWLVHSGLTTSFLLGFFLWNRAARGWILPPQPSLALILWFTLSIYLLSGKLRQRCSHLDLVLPISTRRLWIAHILAVVLSCLAVLAVSAGVVALYVWLLATRFVVLPDVQPFTLALPLLSLLVLAVVLIESADTELAQVVPGPRDIRWRLALLLPCIGLAVLLSASPAFLALAPLGLAFLVGARTWRRLPASFVLLPKQPIDRSESQPLRTDWSTAAARSRSRPLLLGQLLLVIHGARWGGAAMWLSLPWVLLMGVMAAGTFNLWTEFEDLRYTYLPIYVLMLFNFIPAAIQQLAHVDALPVSRRTLFALLTAPALLAFVIGFTGGRAILAAAGQPRTLIEYRASGRDPHYYLYVPIGRDEVSWTPNVPAIGSPWGETHPAWKAPLFRGSRVYLYSPYHTPEGSSPRFVALQISRAIEAIYGRRIPYPQIQERYLELREDAVVLKGERLNLLADYPDLEPLDEGPVSPLMLAVVGSGSLLLIAAYLSSFRAGITDTSRRCFWIAIVVVLVGLTIVPIGLAIANFMEPWAARGLVEILIRRLGETSWGIPAAWLVSLLILAYGYQIGLRVFRRAELPAKPSLRFPL